MAAKPGLRVFAVQHKTSPYGFEDELPLLLNVVDLGNEKTGMIVLTEGEDSFSLDLVEYRDGVDLSHMHTLESIGSAQ